MTNDFKKTVDKALDTIAFVHRLAAVRQSNGERNSDPRKGCTWEIKDCECDARFAYNNLASFIEELNEAELAARYILWSSHGHDGLYGDDGEMQCVKCAPYGLTDYKREPLTKVRLVALRATEENRPKLGRRFQISWGDGAYHVNIPGYNGGEVVEILK
jgi:hypothetical protein